MENSTASHHRHLRHPREDRVEEETIRANRSRPQRDVYRATVKRGIDFGASLILLILLSPLMLLIALAVKLDSRGPALFRQQRLGLAAKPFIVLKFRTMAADSSSEIHRRYVAELANGTVDQADGEVKKLTADPRVTRVGGFLRRTSLDELPQLFNVLAGTMSLVGPRPALEYELTHYRPVHYRRFEVLPGITGLWQVSGRNQLDFHQMLDLDAEYSEDLSFPGDVRILARTPLAAFRHAA